jgi:dihydroxyacid dehydratase/phosphogluconate dehydratase
MGTASTMTSIAEALGLSLPGAASIPAADAAHPRMGVACGRRIVEMIWEDLTPRSFLTRRSFENALVVHSALAGSTNAMIHLVAMARRAGVAVSLDDFDAFAQKVPVIANLRPSGAWLMEDFHIAGGIRPLDQPIASSGGTAILYGNIAPQGCVMKPPAAEPHLLDHTGPVLVFDTYDEMTAAVNDPDLDVTPDHIMVLRNAGPIGGPGMPEWGMLPIPKKLLQQGVRDMLRISDARMSGTSYGACILHVSPEAHVGGPLAALRTGDLVTVNVRERAINAHLSDAEISERLKSWSPPPRVFARGYNRLFAQHVRQAHEGCDFDFLEGTDPVPEPEIH